MLAENGNFNASEKLNQSHRQFLLAFHKPLQKIIVFIVGPISIALYLMGAVEDPSWHNEMLLGGVVAMVLSWFVALFLLLRNRLEGSVIIFVMSVIAFETLEMSLQRGSEATAVLGCCAVLAYATLYSRLYLFMAAIGTGFSIIFSELAKYFQWWSVKDMPAGERLGMQVAFCFVLIPVMVIVLRKRQTINDKIFDELKDSVDAQAQVIGTANRIQPVIDEVVGRIREISNNFVSQASEQASATTEVATTVSSVSAIAEQSATAAANARAIAERTRRESIESKDRLDSVQRGFQDVVSTMDGSRRAVGELAVTAENVEEILGYNREIGEHIKVLAVNAALEAAKAGQYGSGFRVVAEELRSMIVNVDDNLNKSSRLLDTIRQQAKDNAVVSQNSAEALRKYFEELKATGNRIAGISSSFMDTSEQVGVIADAAQQQRASISQVSTALAQIDTAAGQLEEAARVLLEGMDDIMASQDELRRVLSSGVES